MGEALQAQYEIADREYTDFYTTKLVCGSCAYGAPVLGWIWCHNEEIGARWTVADQTCECHEPNSKELEDELETLQEKWWELLIQVNPGYVEP